MTIAKKVAVISVLGPIRDGSLFPNDLELHLFGRELIEKNNPNLEITWFISWKSDWGHVYPSTSSTKTYIFNPAESPELKFDHPSLDHGVMLNNMIKDVDAFFDYVLVMDPDCFLVGRNRLQDHLEHMRSNGIAVSGTPYGMQAPKGFFRDFPTIFALLINSALVDIRALDFRPPRWSSKEDSGIQARGRRALITSLKNQARGALRFVIGRGLGSLLGVHDPVRWWGFLSEFRSGSPETDLAGDTAFLVRESLMQSVRHEELKVVLNERLLGTRNESSPVARRAESSMDFSGSGYFRNHGVFEGWRLERAGFRDRLTWSVVRFYARREPRDSGRYPTSSMEFSSFLEDSQLVNELFSYFPALDLWAFDQRTFAVHLGLPTKSRLTSESKWFTVKEILNSM